MSSPTDVASPQKARKRRVVNPKRGNGVDVVDTAEWHARETARIFEQKYLNGSIKRAKPPRDPNKCVNEKCTNTDFELDVPRGTRVCTFCGAVQNGLSLCWEQIFPHGDPQMPAM